MLQRLVVVTVVLAVALRPEIGIGETDEPGPVRLADRWSYEVRDAATGDIRHQVTVIVVDINDKEIGTRVNHRGKDRPQPIVFDAQWGTIDNSVWKYQPATLGIRTPLRVGKQWRGDSNATNLQKGIALRRSEAAKVAGEEKITTPAGTFDTYRVEVSGQEVNTRDQTKISKFTNVIWYAPQINRWVKKTFEVRFEGRVRDSTVEELTEYSRKP
jgi:hypothetical protein